MAIQKVENGYREHYFPFSTTRIRAFIELSNKKLVDCIIPLEVNDDIDPNAILFRVLTENITDTVNLNLLNTSNYSYTQIIEMLAKMSRSLKYNHNQDVALGDLSTSNIMVDRNLKFYYFDFNLAIVNKIPVDRYYHEIRINEFLGLMDEIDDFNAIVHFDKMCLYSMIVYYLKYGNFETPLWSKDMYEGAKKLISSLDLDDDIIQYFLSIYEQGYLLDANTYPHENVLKKLAFNA